MGEKRGGEEGKVKGGGNKRREGEEGRREGEGKNIARAHTSVVRTLYPRAFLSLVIVSINKSRRKEKGKRREEKEKGRTSGTHTSIGRTLCLPSLESLLGACDGLDPRVTLGIIRSNHVVGALRGPDLKAVLLVLSRGLTHKGHVGEVDDTKLCAILYNIFKMCSHY